MSGPPPGLPEVAQQDHRVWRRLAPLGLLLVGAGVSVAGDASGRRATGARPAAWVAGGTAGLVLVGAGLSVFGEAVKRRALYDAAERALSGPRPRA